MLLNSKALNHDHARHAHAHCRALLGVGEHRAASVGIMTEPDLFNWEPPPPRKSEQQENLERVISAIGITVLKFCRDRGVNGTFHARDLHEHVGDGVAPASADRILRHLRRLGWVDYEIINRRASFYRVTSVAQQEKVA